ncbi:hypothetical protein CHLNCDRAFT_139073 [Chlorella variabilis]|uniref:Conserved oligomeric Golgi complex subunit 1 n=1 Tax=Chlorella variabilis TaxID=554065 RepID=E1ZPA9_CHLVA|nr:hypothetical protein CHLNCDRAFT_139073 [Chlorella variabilis]EFN52303.1 hypothetical protein CHLNCDRAFT_139073 [Chlorella variabilis]|eukprot:XP_005844405.1 hypothetical protein CHLNCDRAFT_139073 [Chlorella variabilis]
MERMEVEKLFQQRPIAAVREFELTMQASLAEKKKQLRETVGESYRDLISSADTIIDISRSCHRLVDLTGALQRGLGELASGIAAGGAAAPPTTSSYDRLYSLGSRIKYLLDTPETIYGCLDGGEFLAASRRYVRAAEVHRLLTAGQAKQVAQRFPLLQHQWPLVKKFRSQVYTAAGAWLGSHGELTATQAASTLAAQALLKPADGAEVLKAFLTARQAYIMQCLSAATSAGADTDLDSLAFILADVATMVCATLAQCGELFLQLPGVTATPLLAQALSKGDSSSADLLFDTGKEADAWKAHVEATRNRLAELSAAGLALECSGWLDQLSLQLRQLGGRLLGPCSSGQGLLQVEAAVKAALEEWQYQLQASRPDAAAAADAGGDVAAMSWGDICQWVLGRPSPLWPLMFEQPLLERAKQLVSRDFSAVVDEEAANLPPSAPGTFQAASWFEAVELQPATPDGASNGSVGASKRRRLAGQPKQGSAQAGAAQDLLLQRWLGQAGHVVQRFDQQLSKALVAALDACGSLAQPVAGGTVPDVRRPSGPTEAAASRALVLEPFVQDRCAEAAEGIAASLDARLLALPHPEAAGCGDARYSPIATQALLLGRVALGLASRSSMLPVVLGPPDQWRASVIGGADAEAAGRRPLLGPRLPAGAPAAPAPSARYERLQQRLHSVGLQGYGKWASWASVGLASALVAGLSADHTLAADVPLRSWDETVIGGAGKDELALEAEPAGSGLEMRFQLPAAPSPAAVLLALAACQEVDRAGGHLLEEEPLQLFKWRLCGSLLAALSAALGEAEANGDGGGLGTVETAAVGSGHSAVLAGKVSEKGVLQLLFDVRFLLDLLSGGRPISTSASDAAGSAAAVAGRRREAMQLEAQLSGRLDPIDWATYEPYLYANKDRAAIRRQVLFGVLLRGNQRTAQQAGSGAAEGGSSMSADSNTLRMAAVGPRFSYLPVTTPAALLRQTSMHQLQNAGSSSRLASGLPVLAGATDVAATPAAPAGESAAAYSFAMLLSNKPRHAGEEDEGPIASSASSAAMGTGVSAAANKLVGLLGDSGLLSSFARGFNN